MGIGMAKNKQTAFEWYLKSAKGGNSDGQSSLGVCYEMWYSKSAEDGNSNGQFHLGICYVNGIGTAIDEQKAFDWYLKSAKCENLDGQFRLGLCYKNGIGTVKNEQTAFELYLKFARVGNSDGQNNLGYCYENGIGTAKDEKMAFECKDTFKNEKAVFKWYLSSAKNGYYSGQDKKKIGKGRFATVYAANWKRTRTDGDILNQLVALKLFNRSKNSCEELIKEKKIELLSYTASDLQIIHSNNIIHCDLHSGNIFQNDLYNAYIGDLGFATSINKTNIKAFMIDKINWPLPCPTSQFPTNFCYPDRQLGYPIIRR
ncbi:hypothetical protein C2G38_2164261 [Gigaspora rosea]|uniref:Protein kinase domain-containing protein n=1 Tax=Gigaspora rosea TaxID=44941 RepID=A0A397W3Z3_9GLOM|nr:hypothetical protein C2G38_2164261 [Gigaspora rosea]